MGRANTIQTNFTSGEVSPRMYGRVDINKYFNGARQLKNMIVFPQGGAYRRPGTRFVVSTKTGTKKSRLIPFVFSTIQPYMLEVGDLYFRVMRDGGVVESSPGVPVEVVTPWLEADLDLLSFTQSADVLYVAHPLYQTRKISRTSHTTWTVSLYDPSDGPYLDIDKSGTRIKCSEYIDTQQLYMSREGTGILFTASGGTPFAGGAGDVGKYIDFLDAQGRWTLGQITAFGTTSSATGVIVDPSTIIYPSGATITDAGPTINSNQETFHGTSLNKRIRLTATQEWHTVIAPFIDEHHITDGGALSLITYNPSIVTIIANRLFVIGDVGSYIEFRDEVGWKLAKITTFVDGSNVTVDRLDELVYTPSNLATKITFSSGQISANYAGTFSNGDVGKYIRLTGSQAWYQMTAYVTDSVMSATVVSPLFAYGYPNVTMVLKGVREVGLTAVASADIWLFTDIGRKIRLRFGARWLPCRFIDVTSASQAFFVTDEGIPRDPLNSQVQYNDGHCDEFRMGAWGTVPGWPGQVGFHEQRLWFARTSLQPQTEWGSRSGDYEAMAPTERDLTVSADNGITYTIASNRANPIAWMQTGPTMLIGTIGAEFQLKATSLNEPITPQNVDMKEQTAFGSLLPGYAHRIGTMVLFIQRGGNKIREMSYDFQIDAFMSKDVTIMSEHILKQGRGAIKSDYQKDPITIVWYVLVDGTIAALTYERDQDVIAWSRHVIGGTSAVVESVACVPSTTTGSPDDTYLIVRRTINASTTRYIERIERLFDTTGGDTQADMFYVDCGLSYSGGAATVFSGLAHLNGETVQVLADGNYVGTFVVSGGGTVTIPKAASKVHIGYGSTALIETLDPEGGSPVGTSQGKLKRVSSYDVRVQDCMPMKVGAALNRLLKITQSDFKTLKTGDFRFSPEQAFDQGGRIIFQQSDPVSMNILAVMAQLDTNE